MRQAVKKMWGEDFLLNLQQQKITSLTPWRKQRLHDFLRQGLPTRRDEAWKYADFSKFKNNFFNWGQLCDTDLFDKTLDAYYLVFVNGILNEELSDINRLPRGVTFSDDVQLTSNQLVIPQKFETPFQILNDALFNTIVNINVAKDVTIQKPIQIVHIADGSTDSIMTQTRCAIALETGATATVFQDYVGCDEINYFNNIVTTVSLAEGSTLNLYKLQREGQQATHIANTIVIQNKNSQFNSYYLQLGAKLSRDDLNIALNGVGASCQLYGFYAAKYSQYIDNHSCISHEAPYCHSKQNYRGIVADKASTVFNGKVFVAEGAKQTSAEQNNKNLLLSKYSQANTKPELEIYNDDVKCSHGATVGQLDTDTLFYLQSRGINKRQAQQLLAAAFAYHIIDAFPSNVIQAQFQHHLKVNFPGGAIND